MSASNNTNNTNNNNNATTSNNGINNNEEGNATNTAGPGEQNVEPQQRVEPTNVGDSIVARYRKWVRAGLSGLMPDASDGQMTLLQAAQRAANQARAKETLLKFGLRPLEGITRVAIRTVANNMIVIDRPDVYKMPETDEYVYFGDYELENYTEAIERIRMQLVAAGVIEDNADDDAEVNAVGVEGAVGEGAHGVEGAVAVEAHGEETVGDIEAGEESINTGSMEDQVNIVSTENDNVVD